MFEGHDPYLVALSVVIAILGGYTGFGLAARIRGTPEAGHRLLLAGAAFFLAVGIWTMHFVGMLAAPLPAETVYLVLPTIISFLICALVVGISLFFVSTGEPSLLRVVVLGGPARARHCQHALCRHAWAVGRLRDDPCTSHGRALGRDRDRGSLWRSARLPRPPGRRAVDAERDRVRRCGIGHALHRDGRHDDRSAIGGPSPPRWSGGVIADAVAGGDAAMLCDRSGFSAVAGARSAQERGRCRVRGGQRQGRDFASGCRRRPGEPATAANPARRPRPAAACATAPRLPVEGADGTHFIDTADVRSVRADAHYTKVHDGTRERMCPWSISEAEAQLDPGLFVRVHRSHIVAMAHVTLVRKEGDGAIVELDGPSPHRVPVSRAKIAEVKARLGLNRRHALLIGRPKLTQFVRFCLQLVRIS